MKINLMVGEAEKTFHAPFVKGLVLREFIKIRNNSNPTEYDEDTLDKLVELIVEAYNGQFTIDEFWNGVDARKVTKTIDEFIFELIDYTGNTQGK